MLREVFIDLITQMNYHIVECLDYYYIYSPWENKKIGFVHKKNQYEYGILCKFPSNVQVALAQVIQGFSYTPIEERELYHLCLPYQFDGLFRFLALDLQSGKYVLGDFYSMDGKKFKFTYQEMIAFPFDLGSFIIMPAAQVGG